MSKAKTSTAPRRAHDIILQGRQTISLWILRFLRCLMLGVFPDARRTDGYPQKQTKETKSSPRTRRRKLINYDVGSLSYRQRKRKNRTPFGAGTPIRVSSPTSMVKPST